MDRLDALLAHVLIDFNHDVDLAQSHQRGTPSLVQWANFLRVMPENGLAPNDIALAARVSRRAIKSRGPRGLNGAWIEAGSLAPRKAWWRLTDLGSAAREQGQQIIAAADAAWEEKIGRQETASLRGAAGAFVAGLELELSHYPMAYGGADGSAIGGRSVPAKPGPPRLPAHGADWKPVVRPEGDTVSDLPLYALVSQAYVAFQIEYEQQLHGGGTMFGTAALAQAFPTHRVPLADIPPRFGVDGSGKTGLERHGIVRVEAEGGTKTAVLTERGRVEVEEHEARLHTIHEEWRDRYGSAVVRELQSALQAVNESLPSDLPDYCVVRWWHDISRIFL